MTIGAVLGDPHLDSERSLKKEFYKVVYILAKIVDVIIFNGDFVDTFGEKAKRTLDEFLHWAKKEAFKEKLIFISSGPGHEGNLLFDRLDIQVAPYALIESQEGRYVIFHGNNVGFTRWKGESWVKAAARVKQQLSKKGASFLPQIFPTDKLILSHCHVRFFDRIAGVFGTGCWVLREDETWELLQAKPLYSRHAGTFILIDTEKRKDPISIHQCYALQKLFEEYRGILQLAFKNNLNNYEQFSRLSTLNIPF